MAVNRSSSVTLPVASDEVIPWVIDLGRYPIWMPLVHAAVPLDDATWDVELRAKVGVFARSKRLRMHRTSCTPTRVVFERREDDGRVHAPWVLEVLLDGRDESCTVTMNMTYAGNLWTAGVLDRVLAHHVEMGKEGLARAVRADRT